MAQNFVEAPMQLDRELKERWVAALRSGKYEQGTEYLRRQDDSYCCLGVLCDVIDPSRWCTFGDKAYDYATGVEDSPGYTYVPNNVRVKIGLTQEAQAMLANLNDSRRASFAEIADWIEANL